MCAATAQPSLGSMLYFTDWSPTDARIGCVNLDTMEDEWLIPGWLHSAYRIAVDPLGGKMYWAEVYGWEIRRANLDGSAEELVTVTPGGG